MTTASAEQAVLDGVKNQLYIGGEWRDGGEGGTIPVEDPATGETLAEVADATTEDADAALAAAHETFQEFRNHPPRERADILRRAYDLITERTDDLALLTLAQILEEAGLPAGVVNVITAKSSGKTMEPLIKDPRARKLSFTGSTAVGKTLIEQSAEQVLRVSMELGGNAPFLIFDDADLDAAVEGALIAKMRNGGEACTSANRFHLAGSVAEDFAERLASRIGDLKVGRGTEPDVKVGPLIDDDQRGKVAGLVEDAVGKGAKVLVGGEKVDGAGYFYRPTVLTDIPDSAELLREEIFGPVAPVRGFDSEDEAIAAANDTEYGLVAYVYTRDINRAFRVIEKLDTGMVGLNQGIVSNAGAPFGGVKQSGYGREGGPEGLEEYLETKYVAMNL